MKRNRYNPWILIIVLLVGLLVGGALGQALNDTVPVLNKGIHVGLSTTNLNLGVISIVFGFDIALSLAAAVGLIIAIILYQQMQ